MAPFELSALANTKEEAAIMANQEDIVNWNYLLAATSLTSAPLGTGCSAFVTTVSFGFGEMNQRSSFSSPTKAVQKTALTVLINSTVQSPSGTSINKRA